MEALRPFQKEFIKNALADGIDIAALSLPRGNGKSWLAAYVLARCLTPGDDLFQVGAEYLLCAASLDQARLVYKFVRAELEPRGGYRFIDSVTRLGINHKKTNTRLKVLSSNGKAAFGIVGSPLCICDEPGAWEVAGGQLMNDALETALGKPNSAMKIIYIGTLAPSVDGWWHETVKAGSSSTTYVQALQGNADKWDTWAEIRRCNPLVSVDEKFKKRLLLERDEGRRDSRLKARFLSYRLNIPTKDESQLLPDR